MINAVVTCFSCHQPKGVQMTEDQFERINKWRETGEHVQDILPNHTADERELFISGICPTCWKNLFGN